MGYRDVNIRSVVIYAAKRKRKATPRWIVCHSLPRKRRGEREEGEREEGRRGRERGRRERGKRERGRREGEKEGEEGGKEEREEQELELHRTDGRQGRKES